MNMFEKILYFLQGEMTEPEAFGWFHLMWIFFVIIMIIVLYKKKKPIIQQRKEAIEQVSEALNKQEE